MHKALCWAWKHSMCEEKSIRQALHHLPGSAMTARMPDANIEGAWECSTSHKCNEMKHTHSCNVEYAAQPTSPPPMVQIHGHVVDAWLHCRTGRKNDTVYGWGSSNIWKSREIVWGIGGFADNVIPLCKVYNGIGPHRRVWGAWKVLIIPTAFQSNIVIYPANTYRVCDGGEATSIFGEPQCTIFPPPCEAAPLPPACSRRPGLF